MSSATFYKWKSKYGGMDLSMMTRLKELEAENARLNACMLMNVLKQTFFRMHCQKSYKACST
jgi:putative transposase